MEHMRMMAGQVLCMVMWEGGEQCPAGRMGVTVTVNAR
jgi:hypothetical protein